MTGADLLVGALEAAGVEVVFGLPGVHNLAAWDALERSSIRLVCVRHEQAAVYAADGYARASGRVGVALTTTGPGAANALGATGEAWASGTPVLVIATDIPTSLRRPGVHRGALHECVDQAGMFAPVVKERVLVEDADHLAALGTILPRRALTAPSRPVYLEVPTDLLTAPAGDAPRVPPMDPDRLEVDDGAVDRAAELLASAQRPLVWAGGGALRAGAGDAVAALAERLAAPVLLTYSARGLLPPDHPLLVGLPAHLPAAGALWDEADAVVVVGSDLDGMSTQNWAQPQPPRVVAINVDPEDAVKAYTADVVVAADARVGAAALAECLPESDGVDARAAELRELRTGALAELRAEHPEELAFLDAFAAALPPEAVVLADMCIPGYWVAGFHPVPAPRRLAYPMGWGTLGFAFPASLGAALGADGPVVSLSGDGGFLFACGELATAAQERLPLTAVVVDDGGYGMLRYDRQLAGTEPGAMDLHTPDFAALAQSFGVEAETVEGLGDEFGAALARHVARPQPTVLVARAALSPPPTTSPRWYRRGR